MKIYIFILLLSMLGLTAQGQSSFAPLGAEWWYQDNSNRYSHWGPHNQPWADHILVEKDTMVDNMNCRKLVVTRWRKSTGNENKYLAGTRNLFIYDNIDTVFMFNNYTSSFEPLYVFNAAVGDTVTVSTFAEPTWEHVDSNFSYVVDSIKMELYDTVSLKTYYTTNIVTNPQSGMGTYNFGETLVTEGVSRHLGRYTEKLGGTSSFSSLLPNFRLHFVADWPIPDDAPIGVLHCYSDSSINIRTTTLPCDSFAAPLSTTDRYANSLDLNFYPNPAKDKITFKSTITFNEAMQITIFDISGRQVWATLLPSNNKMWTIDLPSLNKGMYLLKAKNSKGILQQKLLLE